MSQINKAISGNPTKQGDCVVLTGGKNFTNNTGSAEQFRMVKPYASGQSVPSDGFDTRLNIRFDDPQYYSN